MQKGILGLLFIAIFAVSACSDLKVTSDYDRDTDLGAFKTFNIMRYQEGVVESAPLSMMTKSFIEEAIIDELMARGYTLSDNPDLEVYYFVKLKDRTEYVTTGASVGMYGGSPYYYGYHGGYAYTSNVSAKDVTEGSLIIELVDNAGDKAVWQGIAQKSVTQETAHQREIQKIVNTVFFSYKWKASEADPLNDVNPRMEAPKETY